MVLGLCLSLNHRLRSLIFLWKIAYFLSILNQVLIIIVSIIYLNDARGRVPTRTATEDTISNDIWFGTDMSIKLQQSHQTNVTKQGTKAVYKTGDK